MEDLVMVHFYIVHHLLLSRYPPV